MATDFYNIIDKNYVPAQRGVDLPYYEGAWANQTPESVARINMIQDMAKQGALTGAETNELLLNLMGTNFLEQERESRLNKQMQNLQLSQLYGQLGDAATQKFYGKASLPESIKSKIPKARKPQGIERLLAALSQKDIGSAINAWESPASYGVMKTSPDQGNLDYIIRSMLGSQQQLKQGDITNLGNLYNVNEDYNNLYNSIYQ
jgi:hypothetical protein